MTKTFQTLPTVAFLVGIVGLASCVGPYQSRTSVSPSAEPCRYKTYAFLVPDDRTESKWLDNPAHGQALDDILRDQMKKHGLHEVSRGADSPDLQIRQHLESRTRPTPQGPTGEEPADHYKLGVWKVELIQTVDETTVWSFQINMVLDTDEKKNLAAARAEAQKSFVGDYPRCKS